MNAVKAWASDIWRGIPAVIPAMALLAIPTIILLGFVATLSS